MRSSAFRRAARGAVRSLAVVLLLGVAACDDLLSVDTPGQVAAADLETSTVADLLVTSAISDLECAWNQYTAGSAVHSDEYIHSSGNLALRDWATRKQRPDDPTFAQGECGGAVFPAYTPLHTARFQANDAFRKLNSAEFAQVADLERKKATMRAYGGYALVGLGEGFCEMSVPQEEGVAGPLLTPAQVLELAESKFSEAITLAGQAGNDDIRNMALVGRARVRLSLGRLEGVIADASQVPAGYLKQASRDGSDDRRFNYNFERNNAPSGFRQNASIANHYRDLTIAPDGRPTEGDGVPDPRVEVWTEGNNGTDGVTAHWVHGKYTSRGSPIPIASYREAQLFLAEAHVRSGAVGTAIDIINARRDELGLPRVQFSPGQEEALALVIEERRRDLFLEGGHRYNDMLRFRGTAQEIPFLGEPGSIHPNGVDQNGLEYGTITCYPLPDVERSGNPNIS
jgi:hypothetical protein